MDDRSERLRKRRKRSTAKSTSNGQQQAEEVSDSADSSERTRNERAPEGEAGDEESQEDDRPMPVKEQQMGTYMYLPETQVKHLRRQYNVLKAEYEFEYDEEFEKNRHFYPLVVQYGLERLDDLDMSEIRSQLKELY